MKNSSGVELTRYLYDPDGRRVRRIVSGVETWQVYGIDGELIAEYAYNVGAGSPQKEYGYRDGDLLVVWDVTETGNRQWQWLVSDHLGSPRMVVDRGGEVSGIRRRDFLPFGEELALSIGHRNAAGAGYIADSIRYRFTGKERDSETGFDYFGARYYSSAMGRWLLPDWSEQPEPIPYADLGDPQSLNLYNYVRNNPVSVSDPDGHQGWWQKVKNALSGRGLNTDAEIEKEKARQEAEKAALKQARNMAYTFLLCHGVDQQQLDALNLNDKQMVGLAWRLITRLRTENHRLAVVMF